jgi:hypothetical protein
MELLSRLGKAPAPPPMPSPPFEQFHPDAPGNPANNVELPEPAEGSQLDDESRVSLFRKLRRDAKRRAIGSK